VRLYGIPGKKHIHIAGGIIQTIADDRESLRNTGSDQQIELDGALVLPGFINSHDHLDFNCYPALGNRKYASYTEWGQYIHAAHASEIEAVKKIPLALRVQWGLYKNLLGGFTTVVNHGDKLDTGNELISVFQDCYSLHSAAFEKNWAGKLNRPFRGSKPFVMHIGEGTNGDAHTEIDRVIKSNWFKRKTVAVHGVVMDTKQAGAFAGLVWCPASNFFLLDATADIGSLKNKTTVVFGTDSTLTSPWQSNAHFKMALATGKIAEEELLAMLTSAPSALWQLNDRGKIAPGMKADILVKEYNPALFTRFQQELLLVIKGGEIKVAAAAVFPKAVTGFDKITLEGKGWYVKKGIVQLAAAIREYYPELQLPFSTS
jgi:cytosine/adenosine deaminase-related metal-dependent hydrolase